MSLTFCSNLCWIITSIISYTHSFGRMSGSMKKLKGKNLLLILVGGYICYTLVNQQIVMHRQKVELKKYTVEFEKAKEENSKLQDEVKLSHSLKYIEKLAREKLGLVKEGETPVINNSGN